MIRLTLITLTGLFAAMLLWGTDSGEQPVAALGDSIGEPVETTVVENVTEPVAEQTPEPVIETAEATPEVEITPKAVVENVVETVADTVVETVTETVQEVAQLETLDLTSPAKPSDLIVVQSADSPTGEPLVAAVTAAVTEAVTETVATASPQLLTVNARSVNLRSGPSTSVSVVGSLKRGERAELVSEAADGWLQIRQVSTGQIGFMAGRFLDPVTQ